MALKKEIKLDNGVIVNYHRIVSVNSITNVSTNIEVASYINKEERKKELEYIELQKKKINGNVSEEENNKLEKGINVLIETSFIQIDYDKDMNVDNAYEILKKFETFKNSEDIFEEGDNNETMD